MTETSVRVARFDVDTSERPFSGIIICRDGSLMSCYSRWAATRCARSLYAFELLTDDEWRAILDEIEHSRLPEQSHILGCVFYPSESAKRLPIAPEGVRIIVRELAEVAHLFAPQESKPQTLH